MRRNGKQVQSRQRGFGLVLAVFVLVVLAALGAYILTLGGMQHQTSMLTLQQTRALNAARSGIEWGAYRAVTDGNCSPATTLSLTAAGVADFTVEVSCTQTQHQEGGKTIDLFVIDASATAGAYGSADYVSRHIRAVIAGGSA